MPGVQHSAAIGQPNGIVPREIRYNVRDCIGLRPVKYSEALHGTELGGKAEFQD